jgi:S-layer protein
MTSYAPSRLADPAISTQIQQLYVAYFNRPADVDGLQYWTSVVQQQGGQLTAVADAFSHSAEYTTAYAGLSNSQVVNQVYLNLFGRPAEDAGLAYWTALLDKKAISVANVVTTVGAGAQGSDLTAYRNKVTAAVSFTAGLDGLLGRVAYSGALANSQAKALISSITDDNSLAVSGSAVAVRHVIDQVVLGWEGRDLTPVTVNLTLDQDNIVPVKGGTLLGNDKFYAASSGTLQTIGVGDVIDGGLGLNTLNVISTTGTPVSLDITTSVSNVALVNVVADSSANINSRGWIGLGDLTVSSVGGSVTKADSGVYVKVNDVLGSGALVVDGGGNVNVTATGSTSGSITVGAAQLPSGPVTVSNTTGSALGNSGILGDIGAAGAITVNGGTVLNIRSAHTNSPATINTNGVVTVNGGAATTTVNVINPAAVSATQTTAGVQANSVSVDDSNANSKTVNGSITHVTVNNFTTLNISDNALTDLNVSGVGDNIVIANGGLTESTNTTLNLGLGNTVGKIVNFATVYPTFSDADVYSTLNINNQNDVILANIVDKALTTLNVSGNGTLTVQAAADKAGFNNLKTVNISGNAGLGIDLSGTAVTLVNTSHSTGISNITIDGSKTAYIGGDGSNTVTLSGATLTQTVKLGSGNDTVILRADTLPSSAIDAGGGNDTIGLTGTLAADSSATAAAADKFAAKIKGFEDLVLFNVDKQTIDLHLLGNIANVSTSGGNGLTLNNFAEGGTLVLYGPGSAYTLNNDIFKSAINNQINLLVQSYGEATNVASTGVTATGVERIDITTNDTAASSTFSLRDSITLLGNDLKALTVGGNAGLAVTTTSTALSYVDASGIDASAGFSYFAGAVASGLTIKGSAAGSNALSANAVAGGVNYTGGSGSDSVTINNGQSNTVVLGDGTNTFTATGIAGGNNVVTGGKDGDTVTLGDGNNLVVLGDGPNFFTAGGGNNVYRGGNDVDVINIGGGVNSLKLGQGADFVALTAPGFDINTFSTILDPHAGVVISFPDQGREIFKSIKVALSATASFTDYASSVIQQAGDASTNGVFGWFQYNGNTFLLESRHNGVISPTFQDGQDMLIRLTGLVDLSKAAFNASQAFTLG